MKLSIFSHCVIDSITIGDSSKNVIGGPACYGSLTARALKFDVNLFTKFGDDFDKDIFTTNKISLNDAQCDTPTTKFKIDIYNGTRDLYLLNQCEQITCSSGYDTPALISPVFSEISPSLYDTIKDNSSFTFLDPQGFLRYTDKTSKIYLQNTKLDLTGISAIKLNPQELGAIIPGDHIPALKTIQKNVKYTLYTDKTSVSLLYKDKIYSLELPNKSIYDTTGIGDIFSATFCCTMLKERDFLWALCFAAGSAQASLDSQDIGLDKIPSRGAIETNASYFYNTVKFQQV